MFGFARSVPFSAPATPGCKEPPPQQGQTCMNQAISSSLKQQSPEYLHFSSDPRHVPSNKMRSSWASQLLRSRLRPSIAYSKPSWRTPVQMKSYCSSCDPPPLSSKAKPTSNPPTPPADHRELAVQQELFTTSIYSPGSPLFLPNGARIFNKLQNFLRAQYSQFGFQEVITPTIYKKSLWEVSGHWENYAEDMFSVTGRGASGETGGKEIGEDEEFGLKPMNCPGHCLLFAAKSRSFRDLPVRYADFSPLHRNEISGALSGLTRVRRFHQDDAHIFCRPSQIGEEISKTLDFVKLTYETFKLGSYKLALSTRPADHYIGTEEDWNRAEDALKVSLNNSGQEWVIKEGDGAFYGPKIDIILKDSDGKEHQTATIQLDFQLSKRFELEYQAPAPEFEQKGLTTTDPDLLKTSGPVTPVIIHRAILGSVERFMALLIEHYNGKWPFWISPRQVNICTVSDAPEVIAFADKAAKIVQMGQHDVGVLGAPDELKARPLNRAEFAVQLDSRPISLNKKLSESKRQRYGVIVVIGKNDLESETLSVDMSGIPDPDGQLRQVLGNTSYEVTEDTKINRLKLTPTQLRDVLCAVETAYI